VQTYVEANGCSVVREYVGHGVGAAMHEDPEVPNYTVSPRRGADPRLVAGMTIAVEPMVNLGGAAIKVLSDGWTVLTADGSCSAHYENSILITDGEPEILTVE
jgi:methionyl aminopeptidase